MLIFINGIFIVLWSAIFIAFGVMQLKIMLGGSIWFFYILPLLFLLSSYNKDYAKITWSIASTFIGIVVVNYLHSYFIIHYFNFNIMALVYVIFVPFSLIFLGSCLSIQTFLLPVTSKQIENYEDMEKFRYFIGYLFFMISVAMALTIPLLFYLESCKTVNSIAFEICSFVFALGMLSVLFESRNISKETINYFAKSIPRINFNARKALKLITIGTIVFIIFSAIDELISRGHWLIWSGSMAILVTNISLLYKFGQVIFLPINNQRERPNNFYLPLMKSKVFIVTAFLLLFCLVVVFLAAIGHHVRY
jgi:hypothetical protein